MVAIEKEPTIGYWLKEKVTYEIFWKGFVPLVDGRRSLADLNASKIEKFAIEKEWLNVVVGLPQNHHFHNQIFTNLKSMRWICRRSFCMILYT